MYLDFFGLAKEPFQITPEARFFYSGCDRGMSLKTLCYAIRRGEGILKVVGEVGTGKTMLCRMLPHAITKGVDWVYLPHPNLSPELVLHAIAYELGINLEQNANKLTVMHYLQDVLLTIHQKGRRVVVLVEEAQAMPIESLEELRLLSNLELEDQKLMQIVLFGQPELDQKIAKPEIRQLRERIIHSVYLQPLKNEDVYGYLNFRLRSAGYKGPDIFSRSIAKLIQKYSCGLTRRINLIADKVLIVAFSNKRHTVEAADVKQAAQDCEFFPRKNRWFSAA